MESDSDTDTVMADEMDIMGLLRSLQRENAKNKLSRRDISQIIVQWYLKIMGFIQVDDDKFELRAFGMNTPFEFTSRIDERSFGLSRRPYSDNNNAYRANSASYAFQICPSLNLEQSYVEKDVKKLRADMKRLHSNLKEVWENIPDDRR
ncbi:uncharacterized protein LOC135835241 [Planococcus citri]|uniref:uncharacterized protein LOC135835241 n=1 Tax=Planococcus citri TaxID=170843 RepID=UPI0031F84621